MFIEQITKTKLEKSEDKELHNMRLRFMQLYKKYGEGDLIDGMKRADFFYRYSLLSKAMSKRGIKGKVNALDVEILKTNTFGLSVANLQKITGVTDYIVINGDYLKSPKSTKKVQILICDKEENRSPEIEKTIKEYIKKNAGDKEVEFIYTEKLPAGDYLPLFDLELVPKRDSKIKKNIHTEIAKSNKSVEFQKNSNKYIDWSKDYLTQGGVYVETGVYGSQITVYKQGAEIKLFDDVKGEELIADKLKEELAKTKGNYVLIANKVSQIDGDEFTLAFVDCISFNGKNLIGEGYDIRKFYLNKVFEDYEGEKLLIIKSDKVVNENELRKQVEKHLGAAKESVLLKAVKSKFPDGETDEWFEIQKPYPNEHAARLKEPGGFDDDSFRRTKGGTIYGHIKVPKTISIIWAKKKGSAKPSDNPIPQSLRFPVDNWTVAEAKKWLKDNNIDYIKFEAATKKEKSAWTTQYVNQLPDSSFLYIEPGGEKDNEGKTKPRTLRHFPYKNKAGNIDGPHLRNALARIPQSNLSDSVKERISAKAKKILDGIKKEEKVFEKYIPIIKSEEERIVSGIVYEPGELDTDGDYSNEEEIRKAAYDFMERVQTFKVNHQGEEIQVAILENYIAPQDLTISGQPVKKGTWLITTRVLEDETWDKIKKGEITGYSMAGYAVSPA